jgi:MFS transporter, FHS family, Na+ dependent glucose transporter 1
MDVSDMSSEQKGTRSFYYFITYGVCFISLGLAMASLGPILPSLAEHVDVSLAQISFLFTASSLGYLIGSAGGGRLYDHFKGHRLMLIALGLMVLMSILIPIVSVFYLLLMVMFVFGLGQGMLDVGGNVNLLWVYQSHVGPFMSALHFCFGIGAFLAPIVIHHVLKLADGAITWPFWFLALLFLPSFVGLWLLRSPENPEKGDIAENGSSIDYRLVLLMMLLFFIYVGVETGFGGWIFTYATEKNIANEANASYMNSIFWGALTLGRLISIPLAKFLKPANLLIGNFGLSVVFLGLILIWPVNPIMIWIVSAGLGFSLSSVFPTILALGESRMKITGAVTGLFFLGSSLGGTVIPMVLGQIFEYVGPYEIMLTLFAAAVLGLIVLFSVIFASNRVGEKTRL